MKLNSLLGFVKEKKTITRIAEESGIPYTTLYYFDKGTRGLPDKYDSNLRNYYSRQVYERLKNVGTSVTQANRLRWYPPEKVKIHENAMTKVLSSVTEGALSNAWYQYEGEMSFQKWANINYTKYEDVMRMALQNSRKSVEDIEANYK